MALAVRIGVRIIVVVTAASMLSVTAPVSARVRPLLFGAYTPPNADGTFGFQNLEDAIDRQLDVVSFYHAWGSSWNTFEPDWYRPLMDAGRRLLITWEPWVAGAGAEQPAYRLRTIINGRHDAYIKQWAKAIKAYGRRVYLRPMHEMNGDWYPWGGTVNGNSPRAYRRAWRHIYRTFARNGTTNVRWVWSPYADDVPATNRFERYYPGDSWVDIVALDGYNWGGCEPSYGGWRSFDEIFRKPYRRLGRLTRKPVWIAEVGSAPEGGDKGKWLKNMFTTLENGYGRVRTVIWFHIDKECDWRLTSPSSVIPVVKSALGAL